MSRDVFIIRFTKNFKNDNNNNNRKKICTIYRKRKE